MTQHWPVDEALLDRLPAEGDVADKTEPGVCNVKVERSGFAADLLAECAKLHVRDKQAERRSTLSYTVGALLAIGSFIGFPLERPALAVTGILVGVTFLGLGRFFSSGDLDDRRLAMVSGVLKTFAPELSPKREVSLLADFTSHHLVTPDEDDGHASVRRHRWLTLTLPLMDSTTVRVSVNTQLKRKQRAKRKYTKIKDKITDQITVQLVASKGNAFAEGMQVHEPQIPGLSLSRAVVKPRAATFSYRSPTLLRTNGRYGWSGASNNDRLGSREVVAAIIHSYKAAAHARRGGEES